MRPARLFGALAGLALLSACEEAAVAPAPVRTAAPAAVIAPEPRPTRVAPSEESRQLAAYYGRVQSEALAQGLMRSDGGGPDSRFDAEDLVRNFERIAFYDEYARGAGLSRGSNVAGRLKKWPGPVRITVEHGSGATAAEAARDRREVASYAARLARVTGHPISMSDRDPNFHVLFMSEDDRRSLPARINAIVPGTSAPTLRLVENLPRSIHCLVLAFAGSQGGYDYARAIAVVRTEHPDLMRLSCIHEEMAQGLGLANDSPQARPSIFNDDDEFALLTTHDEMLLGILYDPRLRPGMTLEEARPIVRAKAEALTGGLGPS